MKKYYIIYTEEDNSGRGFPRHIYEDFEEAKSHIMEYHGWWTNKGGNCHIEEIDEEYNSLQVWFFRDGKAGSYFDHRNFYKK